MCHHYTVMLSLLCVIVMTIIHYKMWILRRNTSTTKHVLDQIDKVSCTAHTQTHTQTHSYTATEELHPYLASSPLLHLSQMFVPLSQTHFSSHFVYQCSSFSHTLSFATPIRSPVLLSFFFLRRPQARLAWCSLQLHHTYSDF